MTGNPVVIRFGRLGDTVLLQPLLKKMLMRYGQPCHLLTLGGAARILYSAQPEVGRFISLDSQHGPFWMRPQRWRATFALSQYRQSPFYICEPELRARTKLRPMLKLAGISPDHCQFIEDMPTQKDEHWLDWLSRFSDTTPAAFRDEYDAAPSLPCDAPSLQVSAHDWAERDAWLRARGMDGRPLVLLQPGNKRTMRWNGVRRASDDDKSWPAERWSAIAQFILQQLPMAQVLLCGSPPEADYLHQLRAAIHPDSLNIHVAALPLGCLKSLLEIAHSMISVDTGPAHLAAAMGCPLVVLFGNRSPNMWAPRSGSGSAVSVIGGLPVTHRVDEIDVRTVQSAWRTLPMRSGSTIEEESSELPYVLSAAG